MTILSPHLDLLKQSHNWIVRRADKVPLNPHTGQNASVTNPQTWSDYETAEARCIADSTLGLGVVLTKPLGITFVDLDTHKTSDPATLARHAETENTLGSYSELSPSGGLHIFVKGNIESAVKQSKLHIEMYDCNRYATITGNVFRNAPIRDCNGTLTKLWERLKAEQGSGNNIPAQLESQPETQSDEQTLNAAAHAANGDLFKQLWEGRWQGKYPSQSEADQALYNIIAFYCDNAAQVIRLFLKSALGQRPKAHRRDIQERHIKLAFDRKISPAIDRNNFKIMPTVQNVPLPTQAPVNRKVEIITVANIETEIINWMWESYLPFKKLALLAGKSAAGKSTLTLEFAAVVSRGGEWPDGTKCEKPGHVLIWTAEDGPADTVRPRLLAANADVNKVHIITAINDSVHGKLPFSPATDIPLLKEMVTLNNDISLVIVDPIISAVDGDMNQPNVARKSLQSLVDFAAEVNCCVLGITHFKKNSEGQDPVERIIGSLAFHALPRVILVAGKDENSERRVLAIAKGSVGKDNSGFDYSIEGTVVENLVKTSHIIWGTATQGSARDILASVEGENSKESSPHGNKLENAKQFLETFLANGAAYTKDELNKNAKLLGISANTLTRAKAELGVICVPEGLGGVWKHRLPLKVNNTQ